MPSGIEPGQYPETATNLVPTTPVNSHSYWCTWSAQNYMYGRGAKKLDVKLLEEKAATESHMIKLMSRCCSDPMVGHEDSSPPFAKISQSFFSTTDGPNAGPQHSCWTKQTSVQRNPARTTPQAQRCDLQSGLAWPRTTVPGHPWRKRRRSLSTVEQGGRDPLLENRWRRQIVQCNSRSE